jgi:hypothetical protein
VILETQLPKPCDATYINLIELKQNIEVIFVGNEEVEYRVKGQIKTKSMSRIKFDDLVFLTKKSKNF